MSVEMDSISTREAFGNALIELAQQDENIFYVAADTLKSMGGTKMQAAYPHRAINIGIAEQNMALMGAGLAASGAKVFVATYATFASMRICEQVRTFIAYPNLDVKIISGLGGLSGGIEGVTHQGTEDIAMMRSIPNMTVVVCADAASTVAITRKITAYKGPVYMRIGRNPSPKVFDENYQFEIGRANIIEADGDDAAIICCGEVTSRCIGAAKILRERGIAVKLIEMPCVKPIDREAIRLAAQAKLIVTVEDHNIIGGLGGAVAESIGDEGGAAILRIGLNDEFAQSGECEELLDYYGFSAQDIATRMQQRMGK